MLKVSTFGLGAALPGVALLLEMRRTTGFKGASPVLSARGRFGALIDLDATDLRPKYNERPCGPDYIPWCPRPFTDVDLDPDNDAEPARRVFRECS